MRINLENSWKVLTESQPNVSIPLSHKQIKQQPQSINTMYTLKANFCTEPQIIYEVLFSKDLIELQKD